MSKTLSPEDIKAIGKEFLSVIEKCFKNINQIEATNVNELMNVNEISEKLKLSKQSIYKLIKEEQIKSIKIGKNFYIKKGDFNNYVNSKY
nr:helix-turn-helix domain-containing protein [uncultured Flavobacterium sp.]